jgi:thiol:disulfide interchange protein DsbD
LPVEQRFTYKTSTGYDKEIKTQGDKWATFQEENFSKVSQPLYAILDNNEKLMNHPVGYTPNAKEYLKWLQCGKKTFTPSK